MRIVWIFLAGALVFGCATGTSQVTQEQGEKPMVDSTAAAEAELRQFIDHHVDKVAPLEKEMSLAYWDATTLGSKEKYQGLAGLEIQVRKVYANTKEYRQLKRLRTEGHIKDSLLRRQLDVLYLAYEGNQMDPVLMKQIVELSTEVQQDFNEYQGTVDGKQVTDNDISEILESEKNSDKRRKAWEAYKSRGAIVRDKVVALVKLRNEAARRIGYRNFYEMSLYQLEQDPKELKQIFDDLAQQTEGPFAQIMLPVKGKLAKHFGVQPDQLMPWHYTDPFFQQAPTVGQVDLDTLFKNVDLEHLIGDFFKDADIDPANILAQSDLYEKKDKMPHAYCMHVDRSGDVRILANLRPSEKWASTLLHEMGHAVYDKYIDPNLPWLLRQPSHAFTTEAVAMLFGRMTRSPAWLQEQLDLPPEKIAEISSDLRFADRLAMLVFARWALVVTNFERQMYANPDQDLNKLWWDLKTKYQMLNRPPQRNQPDWASKIHIAAFPVYYHNYMLGEMMASQLLDHMATKIVKTDKIENISFAERTELGKFLMEKVFKHGKSLTWQELVVHATGESLSAKAFAKQFL